jgi:ribonuclease HI
MPRCNGCENNLGNQLAHECFDDDFKKDVYYLFTDGACRGNPGVCTGGAVLFNEKMEEIDSLSILFGQGTNNEAEYKALIEGLKMCKRNCLDHRLDSILISCDSLLIVNQVKDLYKISNEKLKALYKEVSQFQIDKDNISHVYRSKNKRADELANKAFTT